MAWDISKVRNIGISAHIDSGKTTTSERILFYCNKIHAIHEVRGKDGVGAVMDNMELERERGITIQSAATQVQWKDYTINLIDTPGHVDFTVEVERSLRVLDGAIMILCAVAGVQSQSITVDRQLKRYHVPRVAFVNKCDRQGANPIRVCNQVREKLGLNAHMMELPIGLEDKLEGVVDLVAMKAIYFDGPNGEDLRIAEIPANLKADAEKYREELLDAASMFDDSLMEEIMENGYEGVAEDKIIAAIRKGTLAEPQNTPTNCSARVPLRIAAMILSSATPSYPFSMISSIKESSNIEAASKSSSRYLSASAFKLAGISAMRRSSPLGPSK